MSGVKGLSGRKCLRDEEKRLRIIEKSWDIIEQFLSDVNVALRDKIEVASKLVVKDLPTQLEGTGLETRIIIVRPEKVADGIGQQVNTETISRQIPILTE